ncbi:hypothetical protein JOD69_003092 [Methylocaldum sp. RMAD-M]|jgi:hypothetical protein|nr:hypothetical protein [Methylocaldum sp. RMAD-M]
MYLEHFLIGCTAFLYFPGWRARASPPAQGGDAQDQCAIRVPFLWVTLDLRLSWRKPFGRAPRVQICSRQICLWASKDKLAGSEFGPPKADPTGKPQGWVLQK